MRTAPESRKIAALITSVRDEILIPRPDFQRRSVWTRQDKVAFIDTVLNGYPFPEIYVASGTVDTTTGATTEVLVDGQQRITTIYEYFRGVSPFNTSRSIKKYIDLTEDEKREFLSYDVAVRNLGYLVENVLVEVFSRMNSTSYDLNEIERYNAVYLGEFKSFAETVAQDQFLADIRLFSPGDIRRMKDLSFVASLAATMMSNYFHRDDEVENYLSEYNEEFERSAEMKSRIQGVFQFVSDLGLPKGSPAFRKADFYTLAVEIDRQLFKKSNRLDVQTAKEVLAEFYSAIQAARGGDVDRDDVRSYFETTLQNTNDRSQRITRGGVLENILDSLAQPHPASENICA